MKNSLGIMVNSDLHLDLLISLAEAARKKKIDIQAFFTHEGVNLTSDPRFERLFGLMRMDFCEKSLISQGYDPEEPGSGLSQEVREALTNQSRNADLIYECDRYLVL